MFKTQKISALAILIGAVFSNVALADEAADAKFKQDSSYALGVLFGSDLKVLTDAQKDVIIYDNAQVVQGLSDALNGKASISKEEATSRLQTVSEKLKASYQEKMEAQAKQTKEEGEKFAAEFEKKEGVKKTKSGLLYLIDKAGSGATVQSTDIVKVHYTGKLANGKVGEAGAV